MSENQGAASPSWRIETWFPELAVDVAANMKKYHDELQKFNRTLNLVSAKTLPFADAIHFADSILASHLIVKDNPAIKEIYDLGSGNGFPGLVFAIMNPRVRVVLVDADERKCEFLKHIISDLKLPNTSVLNTQIEKMEANSIESCMSRGFASISKAILMTRRLVRLGGAFYHVKSEAWSAEVSEIPIQLCSIWTPALVGEYRLPIGSVRFAVVKTSKIA